MRAVVVAIVCGSGSGGGGRVFLTLVLAVVLAYTKNAPVAAPVAERIRHPIATNLAFHLSNCALSTFFLSLQSSPQLSTSSSLQIFVLSSPRMAATAVAL